MGLYLGAKIAPQRRNDHMWTDFLQDAVDIVLQHVVPKELAVVCKSPTRRTIRPVGIKVVAQFLVERIAQKTTSA